MSQFTRKLGAQIKFALPFVKEIGVVLEASPEDIAGLDEAAAMNEERDATANYRPGLYIAGEKASLDFVCFPNSLEADQLILSFRVDFNWRTKVPRMAKEEVLSLHQEVRRLAEASTFKHVSGQSFPGSGGGYYIVETSFVIELQDVTGMGDFNPLVYLKKLLTDCMLLVKAGNKLATTT